MDSVPNDIQTYRVIKFRVVHEILQVDVHSNLRRGRNLPVTVAERPVSCLESGWGRGNRGTDLLVGDGTGLGSVPGEKHGLMGRKIIASYT